jgi:hypothetical protein
MADDGSNDELHEVAEVFSDLVHILLNGRRSVLDPARIVSVGARAVPAAEATALTVVSNGELRTEASTDAAGIRVDEIQADVGDGPAWEALEVNETIYIDDLAHEPRWLGSLRASSTKSACAAC